MSKPLLIFRIGSLGDTIVALPCFHRIEESFPSMRRVLVTDMPVSQKAAPVESLLAGSGLIHDVIYFPPPPRRLADFRRLRSDIRRTGALTMVYVADRPIGAAVRDLAFFHACGLREIIGAPLSRELRTLRIDPATGHTEREAERLARCLASLGPIDLSDPSAWDLRLRPDEHRTAAAALAPLRGRDFAAVNLGGKVSVKDWGDDNWIAALDRLAMRAPDIALVLFGSADEAERSSRIAASWHGTALNLCGRLSPRESAAALSRALLFVGHDSGPLHIAAAVGVPCVGIYGGHNMPKWWHPMGDHHRILHDMRGVRSITPNDVDAAMAAILSEMPRPVAHMAAE
jgi:ADP-heptose:LPS heptosyltransferase